MFDRITDEVGQMLNDNPELEHMSEGQKQCFWEYHIWIRAFPSNLNFPGSMDSLDRLVQQSRVRERAAKNVARQEQESATQDRERKDQFYVPVQPKEHQDGAGYGRPYQQQGSIFNARELASTVFKPKDTPRRQQSVIQTRERSTTSFETNTTSRQRQESAPLAQDQSSIFVKSNPRTETPRPSSGKATTPHSLITFNPPSKPLTSIFPKSNLRANISQTLNKQIVTPRSIPASDSPSRSRIEVAIPFKSPSNILQSTPTPANLVSTSSTREVTLNDTPSATPDTPLSASREQSLFVPEDRPDRESYSRSSSASSIPRFAPKKELESSSPDSEVEILSSFNDRPPYPSVPDYTKFPAIEFSKPEVQAQLAGSTSKVKEWQKRILAKFGPDELTRVSQGTKVDISAGIGLLNDFRMWIYVNNKSVSTFEDAKTELFKKGSTLVREWLLETSPGSFTFTRTFEGGDSSNATASRKRKAN